MERVVRFAVLTSIVPRRITGTKLRRPRYSFRLLANEAKKLGITTVLVHPDNFAAKKGRLTGWIGTKLGTKQEHWSLQTMPLPNVAYDNMFVHLVMQGKARSFRQLCRKNGIPIFNPLVPNKHTVNRVMLKDLAVGKYIPETKEVTSSADVLQMLDKYPAVYLKPTGGYGGRGVTRIRKQRSGTYLVQLDRIGNAPRQVDKNLSRNELGRWIKRTIRNRHIVQRALDLIHVNGGQVDFRVMVQRTKNGQWQLIGIVPKIAAPGRVVTNLVAGGSKTTIKWISDWSNKRGRPLPVQALTTAALQIASFWSKRYPTLGILGFDMGIDKQDKVWLIELNPKPARSLLFKKMVPDSYRAAAQFAHYLARNNSISL